MDKWYFEMAKKYFDLKIYTVDDVRLFVQAERITKEQFTEITKESFDVVSLPSNIINSKVM
ncbi:phage uncharacterized protein [[Clostridium] sordellii]|uniref:XkdX family protein n=1 Tax=Paraclostridium sordellii TaxID=1505 RepID=UPI0005E10F1F|nr:XkdX family protein [Paeniclostridium sordellii]CEN23105.1 phage uncharacterized protein [[Clostridium] sordellii] [Paeniclostridium sordellii]CEN24048.1 phage uncharacterized protein [[Clostridium] sordellii] [Paeniclostridium sordellii]CEN26263.1 phage uncharacterized protein [[Clostridium] sordellii] [Paeniclostridium sordellii]CEQ32258.1 phage uncharacterized protein [[Clostridium] sordellii] [Paeniclostridium sordellii]